MSSEELTMQKQDRDRRADWRVFFKALLFLKPYWHYVILQILLDITFTTLFMVNPFFTIWMVDEAIPNHNWGVEPPYFHMNRNLRQ